MNSLPEPPDYSRFDQLLSSLHLQVGAAELHGVISALLCAAHTDAHVAWFEELFSELPNGDLLVKEMRQLLGQLYQITERQIGDEGLAFAPFLPSENVPVEGRAQALSEWCQGYLFGLGMAGVTEEKLAEDGREVVADLTELTRLDYEQIESGESVEADLMELTEFVRVGALLVREELRSEEEASHEAG
ncbi:hypothetical protein QQ73_15675 [Candidatus Endoriftia persephone str. Guaymas]|jgi:uncharacterized protein YgfB (UPF0149 family)|uniref:YecA family protein n=3 Tax=Gammaproteobacteria TaxID=1236 RepID=G2FF87_9GAMM|nr:UPF0149 family protein [Candidatus Endoriftia persephone]EGV52772.1 YecA family protein [endosymbiont of Riftia pachyptila (vent Ph05)]EGW54634.1 YecA family protein [endosymbiont of Tevnia jerichonana (vent Tica)]MBA1332465.1 hypothetical protein [Candidatus Endoriftia persephone str. Guaymas]USF87486.1 UPF0149 family protein [Candidatus Endoriftia persephone]